VANEILVQSVKDIAGKAKAGDMEGAYLGYRDLFASEAFASYRASSTTPDDPGEGPAG